MKKTFYFVLLSALAFLLLGCPGPNAPVNFTITYSTEKGTAPEPITVEEDTVLTAEQLKPITTEGFIFKGWFDGETEAKAGEYKVTKNVTLTAKWDYPTFNNTKQFPFVSGKEYTYESENLKDVFVFNSDGTVRYEEFKKDTDSAKSIIWKIKEGYEYHYVADTEKQLIYLYLEKSYFKDQLGIFGNSYMTLDEVRLVIDSYMNEEKFRQLIINSDTLKAKIIDGLVKMKFNKSANVTNEEIEQYKATITDDDIWNTFLENFIQVPKGVSISDYMSMLFEAEFNGATSIFNTILEYHYEEDVEGLKLTQVVYDNATLEDMITSVSAGKLCSELTLSGHSKINIDQNFEYFGEGEVMPVKYTISTLKDGKIYCFPISENVFEKSYKGTNYKIEIDPIPYTETGKGENLVVTITFEGSQYVLKYKPDESTFTLN